MCQRQFFFASLLVGVTLGCGGPAQPPAAPRAEAQEAENVRPAAVAPVQAKSDAAGQIEAKSRDLALAKAKELAELAEAATVNANFKPMPRPALADPEEYALACAVLAAPLDDKPKAAYAGCHGFRTRNPCDLTGASEFIPARGARVPGYRNPWHPTPAAEAQNTPPEYQMHARS